MAAGAPRSPSARFARALLHNNLSDVSLALNDRARARSAFERALGEARGVAGPGAVELVAVRHGLGLTAGSPAERERALGEAESELTRLLGALHPQTLTSRYIRGSAKGRLEEAE